MANYHNPFIEWGVYYPDPFYGGPGYTIFHKAYPTETVSPFYASELYYRLEDMRQEITMVNFKDIYIDRGKGFNLRYDCPTYGGMPEYREKDPYWIRVIR